MFLLRRFQDLEDMVSTTVMRRNRPWRGTNLERAEQALVDAHHGAGVVELAAVVWRAEKGHELALGEELVAVFHNLVGTADEIHVVLLQEARNDVRPECEGHTTVVFAPAGDVLIGIRPQQVAQQSAIGDLEVCQVSYVTRPEEGESFNIRRWGA